MSEIFISHAEEDATIALRVALDLETAGYQTWSYEVDSVPGPSYLVQTGDAVERADVVLLIISPTSLGSHQVTREVVRGLETGKPFLPLLRDVTHVEFQNRQPEWRSAVGAATSIQLPAEGVQALIPRIIAGLVALGVEATGTKSRARLSGIADVLKGYAEATVTPSSTPPPVSEPSAPARPSRSALLASSVVAALVVSILAFWLWQNGAVKSPGLVVTPDSLIEPPKPEDKLDITAIQDRLLLLHDLKGHYVTIIPYWDRDKEEHHFFYGDASKLYSQRTFSGGRSGQESFSYSFWDPRYGNASFIFRDNVFRITCGEQEITLAPVETSTSAALLAAPFEKHLWKHHAYALARDGDGKYYYTDKSLQNETFRFFVGPSNALRQQEVTNVVTDSAGAIIQTGTGKLEIGFENGEVSDVRWMGDGAEIDLTNLPVWPNRHFIYRDMGLYPARLGTACDDVPGQ